MSPNTKNIQISEPLLQAIMHEYIEKMRKRKSTAAEAERLRVRWETQTDFYEAACRALCQAIVFSTLAGTASSDDDFERESDALGPIDDPEVSALRRDVFKAGIRCAVESIGPEMAKELNIAERVQIFERLTEAPPAD